MAFVYLLKTKNACKIGWAKNPRKRVRVILAKIKMGGGLIHQIETNDPHKLEKFWHEKFSSKRVVGEWFALTDDDVREMRAVSRVMYKDDPNYPIPENILATRPEGDGWRLEISGRKRLSDYYQWRRGSGDDREAQYAGYVRRREITP